jgi:hypothetical protein
VRRAARCAAARAPQRATRLTLPFRRAAACRAEEEFLTIYNSQCGTSSHVGMGVLSRVAAPYPPGLNKLMRALRGVAVTCAAIPSISASAFTNLPAAYLSFRSNQDRLHLVPPALGGVHGGAAALRPHL